MLKLQNPGLTEWRTISQDECQESLKPLAPWINRCLPGSCFSLEQE